MLINKTNQFQPRQSAVWASTLLLVVCFFSQPKPASAQNQWTTNGNNINNTNTGNVGIGTTNPNGKLDVYGGRIVVQPSASGGFMLINDPAWGNAGLFETTSSGDIHLKAYSSGFANPQLFLKNGGNVGIGTTSPTRPLEVLAADGEAVRLYRNANFVNWGVNIKFAFNNSSGSEVDYAGVHGQIASNTAGAEAGNLLFTTATSGSLTEKMRITPGGYVGIGTTNPGVRLDLLGNNVPYGGQLRVAASDYAQITFFNSNNLAFNDTGRKAAIYYDMSSSQFVLMNTNGGGYNGSVLLNPNGGSIGIGTFSPSYRLDVQGGQINASGGLCIAGDCRTSWSQVGGGSQWTTSGSNISYSSGNVGVGTTTPGYRLDVQSSSNIIARFGSSAPAHNQVLIDASTGYNSNLTLQQGGIGQWYLGNRAANNRFSLIESTGTVEVFSILQNGSVGIGTINPAAKLDVNGDTNVTGNITVSGNINAKYQDVAEWVPAPHAFPAGTVVVLNPRKSNEVMASAQAYDTSVAGVVSERPGLALGEAGKDKVLVATTGRVKVKVDATRAPIRVGDLLVTSDKEGVAMKSEPLNLGGAQIHRPGTLIGKALEPLEKGTGEILVLLSLQ